MEILFENKHTRDREWAKDAYQYMFFRRPAAIVCFVLLGSYFLLGIWDSVVTGNVSWSLLMVPLVWAALVIFLYNRNVNLTIKRDVELHGKEIDVIVTVTEEAIRFSQSNGAEYQLNYADIKKVICTKKYIYLLSGAKILHSFKRDGFSSGSAEEFLNFLMRKGVKV